MLNDFCKRKHTLYLSLPVLGCSRKIYKVLNPLGYSSSAIQRRLHVIPLIDSHLKKSTDVIQLMI